MGKYVGITILITLSIFVGACLPGSSDDDGIVVDDDDSADDDADDDAADDDVDDDDIQPGSWEGIEILSVKAPDEYSVEIELSDNPGSTGDDLDQYFMDSDSGDLNITAAFFSSDENILTLTTVRQKLGITYSLDIDTGEKGLTGQFVSADTARLWAWDFDGMENYAVTARRAAVGEHCVVYLEQGWTVEDLDETVTAFDEQIFPVETALFYPAPDADGNDRILIFGLNGHGWYGGYFSGTDTYSDDEAWSWWGQHSNEMEMVYINVEWASLMPYNVIPHEFQHLLYNDRHDTPNEYWEYHDEGLAETAVHAVFGPNRGALYSLMLDYDEGIRNGLSLVHWQWGNYENYAQAYMWWIYVASRMSGIETLGEIFDLETGNPDEVDQFIADNLQSDMPTMLFENNIALWAQAETGNYGYNGLMDFEGLKPSTVTGGTTSLDLESFTGAYFLLDQTQVSYPETLGPDIIYAGINSDGNVDLAEPFDIDGGALLVNNLSMQFPEWSQTNWETQPSGPDLPALDPPDPESRASILNMNPAWMDPPPMHPERMDRIYQWRQKTIERISGNQAH